MGVTKVKRLNSDLVFPGFPAAFFLLQDHDAGLENPASRERVSRYRHNRTSEDNGDAHLKRQVMGREVVVAATDGKLDLIPLERVFLS